ncbi:MAG TPA: PGPGW domain-containing protein [Pirellulales bacterium]|nr:PGPGW domain-containing protein [Pirellulales bacterium]
MTFSNTVTWFKGHQWLVLAWAASWLLLLVGTLWAVRWYLISIPPDHFAPEHTPLGAWRRSHPALRWAVLVAKNLCGVLLALVGVIMLVTPGPGWFALLLGLSLVDLPGKRAVEQWIVQRPPILRAINHLRARAAQPALEFTSQADRQS